jgi:hypothetical protein
VSGAADRSQHNPGIGMPSLIWQPEAHGRPATGSLCLKGAFGQHPKNSARRADLRIGYFRPANTPPLGRAAPRSHCPACHRSGHTFLIKYRHKPAHPFSGLGPSGARLGLPPTPPSILFRSWFRFPGFSRNFFELLDCIRRSAARHAEGGRSAPDGVNTFLSSLTRRHNPS